MLDVEQYEIPIEIKSTGITEAIMERSEANFLHQTHLTKSYCNSLLSFCPLFLSRLSRLSVHILGRRPLDRFSGHALGRISARALVRFGGPTLGRLGGCPLDWLGGLILSGFSGSSARALSVYSLQARSRLGWWVLEARGNFLLNQ